MAAEYVILRKFLTKILCSHISMVNGLSGWEDTWSGTECSVGLAVTGCCRGFLPPLLALSCLLPRMGSNSQSSCQSFCLRVTPLYLDSFFTVTSWRREVTKAQVKKNVEGSYSWQISSSGISGDSCKEHVWVGVEGLSQCEWRGTWVSRYRHQVKKKFSAAALTWKPLVAGWAEVYLEMAIIYQSWSHFKVVEDKGSFFWWKFCSKNFFFGVRRKEKTPHQYAEIINVYANEITNQENNENKRTKWTLMDMCCKHANK